jgi:hypothetical protein
MDVSMTFEVVRRLSCAAGLALLVLKASTPSYAADCPASIEAVGRIALVDGRGQTSIIEALDSGYVRRIEDLPQASPISKNHIEGYQGFFAETITTISERATSVQYYKISPETHARLRKALPPKPGTVLTIDYDVVYAANAVAVPVSQVVPPSRSWKVTYTVKGAEQIKIGACNYQTHVIETASSNADNSFTTTTTYSYSPDLKAWLKLQGVFKPADKPETRIDRTIVSIATLAKD